MRLLKTLGNTVYPSNPVDLSILKSNFHSAHTGQLSSRHLKQRYLAGVCLVVLQTACIRASLIVNTILKRMCVTICHAWGLFSVCFIPLYIHTANFVNYLIHRAKFKE